MRLHLQVKQLKAEKEVLIEGINEIRRYLSSEKFYKDTSVNKQDIFNRFEDIQNNLDELDK